MSRLTPEEVAAWNERFCTFNDAVLRKWSVDFSKPKKTLEIVIEAQDTQIGTSGWSLVTLRLKGVMSLKYKDGSKISYQVLSNGLHTLFESGNVGIELGDFVETPASFSELMTSPCHAIAGLIEWDVKPC